MKTLFGKLLLSFMLIIVLIVTTVLGCLYFVYSRSYEEQIVKENTRQASYMSKSLYAYLHNAYKIAEELSFNNEVLSLQTELQTPIFADAITRNDYFELIYAQGMDGMQTGRSTGTLGSRKERWWFIQMEEQRTPFVSESYYSVGTNMPCTSVFYPMMQNGEMIGIMAGDIKLSALHDFVVEAESEGSWTFILDGKGVVVAHPNSMYQDEMYNYAKLTKTVTSTDAQGNPRLNEAGNIITEEQPFAISASYQNVIADMMSGNIDTARFKENGEYIYVSYEPVKLDGESDPWYVLSVMQESVAMQTRNTVLFVILVSMVIIILVAFFIVFLIARNISSPIKSVHSVLQKIKEGDLTNTVTVSSSDEIGEMTQMLNDTQTGIKNLISNIKKEASTLSSIGNVLAENMSETAAAVNMINGNAQSVKDQCVNQSASVNQSYTIMKQFVENIENMNTHIENQNIDITQVSTSIEEMVANIHSVTATLVANNANVKTLMESAEIGREGLSEVANDIQEIARESEGLLEINSVMENISSQTNLLSMNAAIEAAHAGEAGKGFAVVADEIRKLAENSSEQSKTITNVLKKIKESIDKISHSTDNVLNKFEAIDSSVKIVAEQEDNIRRAMEEQGIGSKQILEGTSRLNEISRSVKNDFNEMHVGAQEVIRETESLSIAAKDMNSDMNEMTSGIEHIDGAVNQVNEMSVKNHEEIGMLLDEVSRFKVD
jgi:methyl-accepting chemotaxis protein